MCTKVRDQNQVVMYPEGERPGRATAGHFSLSPEGLIFHPPPMVGAP
jgi:hypothetical protein